MKNKRKALFFCEEVQRVQGMIELAEMLDDDVSPCFVIDSRVSEDLKKKMKERGWGIYQTELFAKTVSPKIIPKNEVGRGLKSIVRQYSVFQLFEMLYLFFKFAMLMFHASRILNKYNARLIFVTSDRLGVGLTTAIIKVASNRVGYKTIVPYLSIISDGVAIRKVETVSRQRDSALACLVSRFVPQNRIMVDGSSLQFYSVATALVLKVCGVFSDNPWVIGQGRASVTCLDTKLTLKELRDHHLGLIESRYEIVGSPFFEKLLAKKNQSKDVIVERVIVVALPQFYEHGLMGHDAHHEEIRKILSPLLKGGYKILLSLHPKMKRDDYLYLEGQVGVEISKLPLVDILPAAEIFIAINSSTIIWSTLMGIKTIFLDCYGLSSGQLAYLTSPIRISSFDDYVLLVEKDFCVDVCFDDDWLLLAKEELVNFGVKQMHLNLLS